MESCNLIQEYVRAAVPLVMLQTADPAEVMSIVFCYTKNETNRSVLVWDCVRGLCPANELAQGIANDLNQGQDPAISTGNPVECLRVLQSLPENTLCVMINLGPILSDPQSGLVCKQALWNLRDLLKTRGAMVIGTCPLGYKIPGDLINDVVVGTIPLPDPDMHRQMINSLAKDAEITLQETDIAKAVDAIAGLSGFAGETAVALSMSKSGINLQTLWERKRTQIQQTPGLSVWRGGDTFADIGGCNTVKTFFRCLISGKRSPRAIVFIDEIEKQFQGVAGDLSGTSQAQFGKVLTHMQDTEAIGAMFIGPPGAAKSAMAKAIGGEAGIPTIAWDLGDTKGGIVGETEQKTATALATIEAVAQGRALWIATCNSIGVLPPELRRRFTLGTFFFDLPSQEERALIWDIWLKKYQIPKQPLPDDNGWTGAEIRQCCDKADRLSISLREAATYVIPVSKSASDQIEALRRTATGKFLCASYPGVYRYEPQAVSTGRKLEI